MWKKLLKPFLFIIITASLTFLGKSTEGMKYVCNLFGKSPSDKDIEHYCLFSFLIGITISSGALPIYYYKIDRENKKLLEIIEQSVIETKGTLLSALRINLTIHDLDFDVRVFTKEKKILTFNWLTGKKYLVINNYNALTKSKNLKGLRFQCHPKQEGIVGITYN